MQFGGVLVIPEILDNVWTDWTQNVWTQRCSCIEGFTTSQIYHAFNLNCSEPISARNEETIMWEQLWVMFPSRIVWTILVWTSPDSRKCNQGRSHGVGNPHNMVVFTSQWIPGSLGVTNAAFDGYSWKWSRFWKCLDHYGLFKRDFEGRPDAVTPIWLHFRKVHGILHKTYDFYYVWTSNKKIMSNLRNGGGTSKFPPHFVDLT